MLSGKHGAPACPRHAVTLCASRRVGGWTCAATPRSPQAPLCPHLVAGQSRCPVCFLRPPPGCRGRGSCWDGAATHPCLSHSAGLHAAAGGLLGATALRVLPDAAEGAHLPAEEQAPHGGVRLQRLLQCRRRPPRARAAPRPAPEAAAAGKRPPPGRPAPYHPATGSHRDGWVSRRWGHPGAGPSARCGLSPAQGRWRPAFPEQPLQLGLAQMQNVCLLCRQPFFSLLWLQSRPPRMEGLHQRAGPGLCMAIWGLDSHNGPRVPPTPAGPGAPSEKSNQAGLRQSSFVFQAPCTLPP